MPNENLGGHAILSVVCWIPKLKILFPPEEAAMSPKVMTRYTLSRCIPKLFKSSILGRVALEWHWHDLGKMLHYSELILNCDSLMVVSHTDKVTFSRHL